MSIGAYAMEGRKPWRAAKRNSSIQSEPREPNGRLQRDPKDETEKQRMAVALAQPHRRGYKTANGASKGRPANDDRRLGYPLGRLLLTRQVTQIQHDALVHWYTTYIRFTKALNLPQVRYGSCLDIDSGGGFEGDDLNPAASTAKAVRARRSFEDLEDAMRDGLGAELTAANAALMHVVALDRDPTSGMIGTLRTAANVIDKHRTARGHSAVDAV